MIKDEEEKKGNDKKGPGRSCELPEGYLTLNSIKTEVDYKRSQFKDLNNSEAKINLELLMMANNDTQYTRIERKN